MDFLDLIDDELDFQRRMLNQFAKLKRIRTDGTLEMVKKRKGYKEYKEYYIRSSADNIRRYVRKDEMVKVVRIQAAMTGVLAVDRAEQNIELLRALKEGYKPCDFLSVQRDIDDRYHFVEDGKPWTERVFRRNFPQSESSKYRHELIHSTSFGLMVRSKNEAFIAERLFASGLEFYYEKLLRLIDENGRYRNFFPDFTIVLPSGKTIYWEHKGMINDEDYLKRDMLKTFVYHKNGIFQPRNLIVTCDGPEGEFSGVEISVIIDRLLTVFADKK